MKTIKKGIAKHTAQQINLEDDNTATGGIACEGETLWDFLESELCVRDDTIVSVKTINRMLKECGIATIDNFQECEAGTCFKMNGRWNVTKSYYGYNEGFVFKSYQNYFHKMDKSLPVYQPDCEEDPCRVYTRQDFLEICGDNEKAREVFVNCDWQCPETMLNELTY